MRRITSVCVFCGSSSRVGAAYRAAAVELGALVATHGIRLVYGGGRVGLMGLLADAALAAGGEVIGVIPQFLVDLEVAHTGLTELRVVESMHERKRTMAELAEAFIALPGGFGTLEEAVEVMTWHQLGLHRKPTVLVGIGGFWDPFRDLTERFVAEGFAHPDQGGSFTLVARVDGVLDALAAEPGAAVGAALKWT
jgi:uncharacterized protein (TIGR00730 family)